MKKIKTAIRERCRARRERFQTIEVQKLPGAGAIRSTFFPGTYSVHVPSEKRRYILQPDCLDVGGGLLETPTALARDYLAIKAWRGERLRGMARDRVQAVLEREDVAALAAYPGRFEDGYYLDVWHAYYSMMLVAGWRVSYCPGEYLMAGEPPVDYPFRESGVSRNALVSSAAPRQMVRVDPPGKAHPINAANPILNLSLNALIRDLLTDLAYQAIRAGAIYAHTDGYIAPDYGTMQRIGQMVRDYGLDFTIKGEGPGEVRGVGCYRVGGLVRGNFETRKPGRGLDRTGRIDHGAWLRGRFAYLAAARYPRGVRSGC